MEEDVWNTHIIAVDDEFGMSIKSKVLSNKRESSTCPFAGVH
jgi:hypothetical protein